MFKALAVVALSLFVTEWAHGATRRRAVIMPEAKTTAQMIDEAERRGEINAETALVYRVLADFDDPRLPAKFRGTAPSRAIDSSAAAEAVVRYDSLSEQAKAIVAPFLIPPFHQGSWANRSDAPSAAGRRQPDDLSLCGPVALGSWHSVLSPSRTVRIWWRDSNPGDAAVAASLTTVADKAILTFTSLLGRQPLPDGGSSGPCRGGDDAIDVALVDPKSKTVPFFPGTKAVPSYILLQRNPEDGVEMTLVHELFHVFQYTYNVREFGVITHYKWLVEATATWAQHHYSPAGNSGKEHRAAPFFLSDPSLPLYHVSAGHEYGAYLFFLYLTQKYGNDIVRNIWDATLSADALNAVNNVIAGGFRERWPEFAREAWNRDPANTFQRTDTLADGANPEGEYAAAIGANSDSHDTTPIDMAPLTASYHRYVFNDPNVRTFHWINGLTMRLTRRRLVVDGEDFGEFFFTAPAAQDVKDEAKVQALVKVGGSWRTLDWSNEQQGRFCRQKADERIEELVLIYTNSQFREPGKRLKHSAEPPILLLSNLACSGWRGDITYRDDDPVLWSATGKNLTFEYASPFNADEGSNGTALMGSYYYASGSVRATISGSDGDCSYSGDSTYPLAAPGGGTTVFVVIHDNAPPSADVHRGYWGATGDASPPTFTYSRKCDDDADNVTVVPYFLFVPPRTFKADRSGLKIEGAHEPLEGGAMTWDWRLQASP